MLELLAGLVPGLATTTARSIVARADGIPLYAVETVRMLVADGRLRETDAGYEPVGELGELAVPETLQALIAARLDGLPAADRAILQDAAVLGQSFTLAGLSAVTGQAPEAIEPRLRVLVDMELLDQKVDPRSPERGQYAFVQALIREVAYATLRQARPPVAPSRRRPLLRIARRGRARRRPRRALRRRLRGGAGRAGGRRPGGPGPPRARGCRRSRHGARLTGAGDLVPDPGEGRQGRADRAGRDPRAARPGRDRRRAPGPGRAAVDRGHRDPPLARRREGGLPDDGLARPGPLVGPTHRSGLRGPRAGRVQGPRHRRRGRPRPAHRASWRACARSSSATSSRWRSRTGRSRSPSRWSCSR